MQALTVTGLEEPEEQPDNGRFAGSGRAHECHRLATRHGEVDVGEHLHNGLITLLDSPAL